jgi:hypothetical protein
LNGDLSLAEQILARIGNEELRRKTSTAVFGPFVRRAAGDGEFEQAKLYALRIGDSLGRTMVVDWVGRAIQKRSQNKAPIKEFYDAAVMLLERDERTEDVVRGLFILSLSALEIDQETAFAATRAAMNVLNRLRLIRPFSRGSDVTGNLGAWISESSDMLRPGETLDLSELIGAVFQKLAKRNLEEAMVLSLGISQPGLSSLARLGALRVSLAELKSRGTPRSK